jgi:hypothetical protein
MSVDGSWNAKMETPMGTRAFVLTLKTDGGALTGTMSADGGAIDIYDGAADGDKATWKTNITSPMALTLEFNATFGADAVTGTVKLGMFGNAPLSGTRA